RSSSYCGRSGRGTRCRGRRDRGAGGQSVGLGGGRRTASIALRLGVGRGVLLYSYCSYCGIGTPKHSIHYLECGSPLLEYYLIVGVGVCQTCGSTIVSACSPFYVEGAVRSRPGREGEDAVVACCSCYLVYLKGEDVVGG